MTSHASESASTSHVAKSSHIATSNSPTNKSTNNGDDSNTIYQFILTDARDRPVPLRALRNRVILIVNVASLCGFTPQYTQLEQLYQRYQHLGFIILAFPCNQFANQEPASQENIALFCSRKFNVTFPILKKCNVNGPDAIPLYNFLKSQKLAPMGFKGVRWNFEKFLIDKRGHVVSRHMSGVNPLQLEPEIIRLLQE